VAVVRLAVLAAAVACCACGEPRERARDTALVATPSGGGTAPASACPGTGQWARSSILARLEASGLAPKLDSSTTEEAPLTERGLLIRFYNSELEIFLYPDSAARRRAQASLDTTKYGAYDAPLPPLGDHPTLIVNSNAIAILHSRSDHQRERINDAITAGPPQPPAH